VDLSNIQLDKQKKIFIVMFLLLIAYVDSAYILKAQKTGLNRQEAKISRLKTDLANLNRGLESMRLGKNSPEAAASKQPGQFRILNENQISQLLQEISGAANKFDITIVQIRPSRSEQKTKTGLVPMLINLEMSGDYHNLGKFIQAMESSRIFMQVDEMDIATQLPDYMKQKVTLVLKTYVTK
jgi:Tfp pilus assembly protein PilO